MKKCLTCSRGILILLLLLTASTSWAQGTAQRSGTVRDESGGVLIDRLCARARLEVILRDLSAGLDDIEELVASRRAGFDTAVVVDVQVLIPPSLVRPDEVVFALERRIGERATITSKYGLSLNIYRRSMIT